MALIMFVIASSFARINIDPHHQGMVLKPAIDVLNGMVLYRDTYSMYGAFYTYFQALALWIFGAELLVLQIQTAFMYAVSVFLLYKLWRHFLPKAATMLSVVLFIAMAPFYTEFFYPWSSVFTMVFTLIIIFILYSYINKESITKLLLLGVMTAVSFYTRQAVGGTLFLAVIIFLIVYALFVKE
ncbi:MAG: glycosyltransferase family 39 protein [Oscillospiraceae bacterium]|jgi:4-amino-4-deoxy-L-arabinose transferase-like glycosyltransferase|nr:glycosyltransferase family 39 protein [Oscillospiraceae bacterium]